MKLRGEFNEVDERNQKWEYRSNISTHTETWRGERISTRDIWTTFCRINICIIQWFLTRDYFVLLPQRTFGTIWRLFFFLIITSRGCYWHLVGRSQRFFKISYNEYNRFPQIRIIWYKNISWAAAEKLWYRRSKK